MDEKLAVIVAEARERFPLAVSEPVEEFGQTSVDFARDGLSDIAGFLRDEVPFELLADWSCVDFLGVEPSERRFMCAAHLASVRSPERLRLRVWIPEGDECCPSLTALWPGADYMEREIFDFFGITFDGHPDLRRIFMPEDWEGHPQRKDYPLGGVNVQYKNGAFIPPPNLRVPPEATTGYPGRTA